MKSPACVRWNSENDVDPIDLVCRRIVAVQPEDLPGEMIDNVLAGIHRCIRAAEKYVERPASAGLAETLMRSQGRPESRVLGSGQCLPAHEAAAINVARCWLVDADDRLLVAPAVWGALATSDAVGSVTDAEFITAVALSIDLGCRLQHAMGDVSAHGHHRAIHSGFVAAACAAKLRKFEPEAVRNALGITLSQSSGTTQAALDRANVEELQIAFNAGDGLRSAMFASIGVSGVRRVVNGPFGLFKLFSRRPDESALAQDDHSFWAPNGMRFALSAFQDQPGPASAGPIPADVGRRAAQSGEGILEQFDSLFLCGREQIKDIR